MNKLFVAGCSVSDYTNVDKVYGEYLSEMLEYDYVHEAVGCGSNWRMWRKITGHILAGRLTKNDLLIIQYTDIERKEFWSRYNYEEHCNIQIIKDKNGNDKIIQPLRERYSDDFGDIIRFKLNSYIWQGVPNEAKFFKLYEENFVNDEYNFEVTNTQHFMFQSLLKEYNINTIFLDFYARHYYNKLDKISGFNEHYFNIDDIKIGEESLYLIENDNFHFNELGHKYVSEKLYEYIKNNNLINEK